MGDGVTSINGFLRAKHRQTVDFMPWPRNFPMGCAACAALQAIVFFDGAMPLSYVMIRILSAPGYGGMWRPLLGRTSPRGSQVRARASRFGLP
jgi:hypothetical protein